MFSTQNKIAIKLAKTLWFNTYRGQVTNELGEYLATIRIIPGLPLDRSEVPENAPEVAPYVTVLVEEAAPLEPADLVPFESKVSDQLLELFEKDGFRPEHCTFFYPTPPQLFDQMIEHE